MGGIDIVGLQAQVMRHLIEGWREMFGGETIWFSSFKPRFDIFERMRIANESGAMFRG